ncbi:conserved Plasmodium protein, unknown function [Plasmodium gallinaceum]|uniref:EamA domain-containing protein n=1 Tax=Plasmodium gallinaceum TaxID=5849 RepID=A0A1J1GZI6_PLAGA|nr:conserved Plasmodium protein, unknown function [Plasmodium gallinaceum]CRG96435.1 conserved Plasmodium protein, unknown function [Plasmodium gallinaceum]
MKDKKYIYMIYNSNIINSFISSICGTLGSVFFKKAFDISLLKSSFGVINKDLILQILLRIIYFLFFLFFNILMIKYYLLLMKQYSAFFSTVLNFSFNFFLSALFGIIFFNEKRNFFWLIGSILIMSGLILILKDTEYEEKKKK